MREKRKSFVAVSGPAPLADADRLFLLSLEDEVRDVFGPHKVMSITAEALCRHLEADRVGYAEIEGQHFTAHNHWSHDAVSRLAGPLRLGDLGAAALAELNAARTLIYDDVFSYPWLFDERTAAALDAVGARAAVVVPLVKESRLVASVFVHQRHTRQWGADDIRLVREVAERTWGAVQRARVERALRVSESRYRSLFNSIDQGFCIVQVLFDEQKYPVDYCFLDANPAFERKTGLRDVVGKCMRELAPMHEQQWFDMYGRIALTGYPERFEGRAQFLGNRWYQVYAFRIGETHQRRIAILFEDITERKENEKRLYELTVERERLLEAERAARSDAEHAMGAKDEFLATLSHELRTPLSNVVSWARILQMKQGEGDEGMRKGLAIIVDNALAQSQLIADLLDMSRIAAGKLSLEIEPVDLAEVLDSTVAAQEPAAHAKGIELMLRRETDIGLVPADVTRLRQVIWNLLSNAVKFTPKGGRIEVSVRRAGDFCEIDVHDSGEGIDAEFLPHLFDRFRQADSSTTRRHGGLGLGLSIVKQLVELHEGTVEAHSAGKGRGATFRVRLPLGRFAFEGRRASYGAELRGVRVLVVEDQSDMREYLQRTLEEQHAEVTVVDSGALAVKMLRQATVNEHAFDVLLSDIGMPDMDGYELIRIVRHELHLGPERLGAIALTAFAREEDRQRALAAGFQAHLTKPCQLAPLLAVVRLLKPTR